MRKRQGRDKKRAQRYMCGGKTHSKASGKAKVYKRGGIVRGGGAATRGLKFTRDG